EIPRVDRLEADRGDFAGLGQHADLGIGQLVEAQLYGRPVIGDRADQLAPTPGRGDDDLGGLGADPLDGSAGQERLGRRRALPLAHVEEAVLEAGAAQVGDEDLHREEPPANARTTAGSGRGITCAARSSPIRAAASAPASTAARTLLTSPRIITLTTPPSSFSTELASSTLAAVSIGSPALISPTRPMVSIRPRAFPFMISRSPAACARWLTQTRGKSVRRPHPGGGSRGR